MKATQRTQYLTRDSIMKLLSDEEIARVSTAETAASLADGDEYVDLEHLEHGVSVAPGKPTPPMGHLLPRKAVHENSWSRIVHLLASPPKQPAPLNRAPPAKRP